MLSILPFIPPRLVGSAPSSGLTRKSLVGPIRVIQVHVQTICTFAKSSPIYYRIGTDHQKIAKIDRENEVAPPPKIPASVGKVRAFHVYLRFNLTVPIRRYNKLAWIRVFPRRIVPKRSTRSLPCYKTMNPARPYQTTKFWPNWSGLWA